MISVSPCSFYNEMSHISQINDSQILSKLNKIVKTKVMNCMNTNSKRLDLTNTGLDFLSSNIFNISMFRNRLHELSLNKNALIDIPESIELPTRIYWESINTK